MRRTAVFARILTACAVVVSVVLPLGATASAAPGAPGALAPNGSLADGSPTLSWSRPSGAVKFKLQVATNPAYTSPVVNVTTEQPRYAIPVPLPTGTVYWRVQSVDSRGALSDWAGASFHRVTLGVPVPSSPPNGAALAFPIQPVVFAWSAVQSAQSYTVEVDNAPDFIGAASYPTKVTSLVLNDVQTAGQPSYWRVRAVFGNGVISDPSPPQSYSIVALPPPTNLSPPKALSPTVTDVVLQWDPVPGAAKYQLQVSLNDAFTHNNVLDTAIVSTRYSPPTTFNNDDYFWRVRGIDIDGNFGAWSAPQESMHQFRRAWPMAPTLTYPANGVGTPVQALYYEWTPVPHASAYVLDVGGDINFSPRTFSSCKTNHTTYTPHSDPPPRPCVAAPGQVTYWRVRAIDGPKGVNSLYSPTYTFIYEPPANGPAAELGTVGGQRVALDVTTALDPTSPEVCTRSLVLDDSLCTDLTDTPVLAWDPVPGAGLYLVYLSADRAMTNILKTYKTPANFHLPTDSLKDSQAGTAYYWFVRPCVTEQQCGPLLPAAHAFEKRANALRLFSPSYGAQVADQITFTWQDFLARNNEAGVSGSAGPVPTQEAHQYRIQVSAVADFASLLDTAVVDQTTYTSGTPYPEGPLYWRVQPIDGSGNALTWSTPGLVHKVSGTVAPLTPSQPPAASSATPYFRWQPTKYAARYDVEVYRNDDATFSPGNRVLAASVEQAAYAPTTTLVAAATRYQWRVRRVDGGGNVGPWGTMPPFTITGSPPTQVEPINGAFSSGHDVTFTWTQVAGASRYRIEWNTTPNGGGKSQDTVGLAWAPTERLGNGTWFWRVTSLDPSNSVIGATGWRAMTVDGIGPTVASKGATTNVALRGPLTVGFSEPVLGVNASTLQLVLGQNNVVPSVVRQSADRRTATIVPASPLVAGQSYSLRLSAAIHDTAGLALPATSWTVRATTTIQNDSPGLVEMWDRDSAPRALGRGYAESRQAGDRAVLRFTGTAVTLVGRLAKDGGYASVRVDGGRAVRVSFHARTTLDQRAVFTRTRLANKAHTLEVIVAGTRPAASSGTFVRLDAARVGRKVIDDRASAWTTYFKRVRTSMASGGSYDTALLDARGETAGQPAYKASFAGRSVALYAITSPASGIARVYVDGLAQKPIDLYSARAGRKKVFSKSLTNRAHTVVVYVTGTKRPAARGTSVSLDSVTTS